MLLDSALNEYQRQHNITILIARAFWSWACASGSRLLDICLSRWKNDRHAISQTIGLGPSSLL